LTLFCVALARQQARWPMLRAFAHPQNIASQRVLLKAGFQQERFVPEMERFMYRRDLRDS
jgi:RimJ/RimL family protein N-acetyltransferase